MRNKSLDGIRTLAVAVVIAYHAETYNLGSGGHAGVAVFCALSGWLITTGLLNVYKQTGGLKTKEFYAARAVRLLPALLVLLTSVALVTLMFGGIGKIATFEMFLKSLPFVTTFTTNIALAAHTPTPYELVPTWSLALENQYYILLPLIIATILFFNFKIKKLPVIPTLITVGATATVLAYSYVWSIQDTAGSQWLTFSPLTTAGALLAGTTAASIWHVYKNPITNYLTKHTTQNTVFSLVAIGIIVYALYNPAKWFGDYPLLTWGGPLLAAATIVVIVTTTTQNNIVAKILSLNILVWLGQRSYGIYLFHVPLLIWVTSAYGETIQNGAGAVKLLAVGLTVLAAAASYRWVEQPLLVKYKTRNNTKTISVESTLKQKELVTSS